MGRRDLLSAEERRRVFGMPTARDDLARLYTFEAADLELIGTRREDRNRLGFGVQLALQRHPGLTLAQVAVQPDVDLTPLTTFVAGQLRIPAKVFTIHAARGQTRTDHAGEVAAALGLRSPTRADLPMLIEAAASAAWATDKGEVIVAAMIAALREAKILLPAPATIERAGVTGRAKARSRTYAALLAGLGPDQVRAIDALPAVETRTGLTRLTELRTIPIAVTPDHVRDILAQLRAVRALGIDPLTENRIHPDRLARLAREGRLSPAYLMDRYTTARRRATIVALLLDLEARLIDAAIEMADKLIGAAFTRGKNAQARQYTSTARDVGRLMRMFRGTIDALAAAAEAGEEDRGHPLTVEEMGVALRRGEDARSLPFALA